MRHVLYLLIITAIFAAAIKAHAMPSPAEPTDRDYDLCARTVWGEVRSQGRAEQAAVIHVIYNRWTSGRWGHGVGDVVLAPWQFSTWNDGDPNRSIAADPRAHRFKKFRRIRVACRLIFEARIAGDMRDPTEHACYYWHGDRWPHWAGRNRYMKIGAMRLINCRGSY